MVIVRILKLHVNLRQVLSFQTKYLTSFKNRTLYSVTGIKTLNEKSCTEMENIQELSEDVNSSKKRSLEMTDETEPQQMKKIRSQKKKKVAMLLSFCGQGYLGMQINHGFKTIEGDLFEAFLKLGIMDEESFKLPQSIHFQRAARTDKGVSNSMLTIKLCDQLKYDHNELYLQVSAAHQVVSFKMSKSNF